jgi:hypothetical protein
MEGPQALKTKAPPIFIKRTQNQKHALYET